MRWAGIGYLFDVKNELVPLKTLLKDEEVGALPGFPAMIGDRLVTVTAVLERTVVYEPAPGEPRQLARIAETLVDPTQVTIRRLDSPAVAARRAAKRGVEASRNRERAA
jgi:hypothetical protein